MRERVVIGGGWVQRSRHGGHAWVFLHWILGFRRLGWDVLFVDRLDRSMATDGAGAPAEPSRSAELEAFVRTMRSFGLDDAYSVRVEGAAEPVGRPDADVRAFTRDAAFVLDVMGYLDHPGVLAEARRLAFLDIDPGLPQMWRALGLHDAFHHDVYLTVGWNVGRAGCPVPDCGLRWHPVHPPVVLDQWPATPPPDAPFRSVATWRGHQGVVEFGGRRYGLRCHEFRRLLPVARRARTALEIALDIDAADGADRDALLESGWGLVCPRSVASDPVDYRRFVVQSGGEFSVAKNLYVESRGGWFSDRSASFLAAGRPVVAQDTGFGAGLPVGEGLLAYRTADEAVDALDDVAADPRRHGRAAHEIARAHLDSDRVLGRVVDLAGAT